MADAKVRKLHYGKPKQVLFTSHFKEKRRNHWIHLSYIYVGFFLRFFLKQDSKTFTIYSSIYI